MQKRGAEENRESVLPAAGGNEWRERRSALDLLKWRNAAGRGELHPPLCVNKTDTSHCVWHMQQPANPDGRLLKMLFCEFLCSGPAPYCAAGRGVALSWANSQRVKQWQFHHFSHPHECPLLGHAIIYETTLQTRQGNLDLIGVLYFLTQSFNKVAKKTMSEFGAGQKKKKYQSILHCKFWAWNPFEKMLNRVHIFNATNTLSDLIFVSSHLHRKVQICTKCKHIT